MCMCVAYAHEWEHVHVCAWIQEKESAGHDLSLWNYPLEIGSLSEPRTSLASNRPERSS